jgi:hypothetical protein
MEKLSWGNLFNKCLTMVVLPAPDGAENIMSLPCINNKVGRLESWKV